jgi:hypothetical protein
MKSKTPQNPLTGLAVLILVLTPAIVRAQTPTAAPGKVVTVNGFVCVQQSMYKRGSAMSSSRSCSILGLVPVYRADLPLYRCGEFCRIALGSPASRQSVRCAAISLHSCDRVYQLRIVAARAGVSESL